MEKLKMHSPNLTDGNIARIRELFPGCVTEARDESGALNLAVDFDQLKQELSDSIVEGPQERYHLNWPGKREALLTANAPIAKTLRPCREESVDFDTTKNLFIEGDNLDALKLLQETYLGKVKMIYIDPPYNTGNDFIYEDDFAVDKSEFDLINGVRDEQGNMIFDEERWKQNSSTKGRFHSDWLSIVYSRLKLAKNLLSEEGVIVIHIDEHEYPNLEKVLAEIYGENNNLGTIVWDKRNPKGDATGVAQQHEHISIYCKNQSYFKSVCELKRPKENASKMIEKVNQLIKAAGGITDSVRKKYKDWLVQQNFSGGEKAYNLVDKTGEVYQSVSMAWPNKKKAPDDYFVPLIHPLTGEVCPIPERGWRNPSATMKELLRQDLILFGQDESTQPRRKYLLKENLYENLPSLLYYGGSDDALLSDLGLFFDNPKSVIVSKRLISSISKENDIIVDFFAGSSTTAHAVLQLNAEDGGNRKFIMVQLPEPCNEQSEAFKAGYKNIAEISKERIRRAGKKIKDEKKQPFSDSENSSFIPQPSSLDTGFRVLKIDSSNMAEVYYTPDTVNQGDLFNAVDNIKPDRKPEDLLFQVLLDAGVDLSLPIRKATIQGKTVFFVDENALVACFDTDVNEELVRELAQFRSYDMPIRKIVFRDNGFASDAVKINVEQIFRQLSPETEVKSI